MTKKTTITEALAELKTLDSKIETTKNFVLQDAIRQGTTIDPLADDGGTWPSGLFGAEKQNLKNSAFIKSFKSQF